MRRANNRFLHYQTDKKDSTRGLFFKIIYSDPMIWAAEMSRREEDHYLRGAMVPNEPDAEERESLLPAQGRQNQRKENHFLALQSSMR